MYFDGQIYENGLFESTGLSIPLISASTFVTVCEAFLNEHLISEENKPISGVRQ